ncbi:MAG: hypothetical protein HYZ81_22420, partial [Nitrospinae bacterium]|nr:hypothetical protein [Nitrospinota bacterium]
MLYEKRRQVPPDHPIRRMFRSLTEMSFERIELRDRDLTRYVADLLVEFVHIDNLYNLHDDQGKRLETIVDMLLESAAQAPAGEREARKHIGDYTLFMMGIFPEYLKRVKTSSLISHPDVLMDYTK